ncbi:hypothetical protein CIB48_g5810 [Xylaria polymorpha]|nr:hypothetical protein CIB48_g5810 [Xylaria polymorpha]
MLLRCSAGPGGCHAAQQQHQQQQPAIHPTTTSTTPPPKPYRPYHCCTLSGSLVPVRLGAGGPGQSVSQDYAGTASASRPGRHRGARRDAALRLDEQLVGADRVRAPDWWVLAGFYTAVTAVGLLYGIPCANSNR